MSTIRINAKGEVVVPFNRAGVPAYKLFAVMAAAVRVQANA